MKRRIRQIIEKYEGCERGNIASFAKKINCAPQLPQKWVKGISKPGADYRSMICKIYGISRDWLDTGSGSMENSPSQQQQSGLELSWSPKSDTLHQKEAEALKIDLARTQGRLDELREQYSAMLSQIGDALRKCSEAHAINTQIYKPKTENKENSDMPAEIIKKGA